ncbi:hypothetical protein KJ652_01280 [Patescibacteria group bacterium]|nr:hypothetical protein [Patescibacteria group bacterium]MBU1123203.1 hypothetical protein [Patescibacteria group bacterium]MBU1911801.1 hypothetical protein [Patescibacteria group bacterium]
MSNKEYPKTTDDKLNEIILHLRKLDRRDRNRTWGGFIKTIIYFGLVFGSIWYAYAFGDQLLEKVAQQAAKQAAIVTEQQGGKVLEKFEGLLVR